MKSLSRLDVTIVPFKCNKMSYSQWDGLAMGASLEVILAISWINSIKDFFSETK